jgi:peroxiredoxin Q/BCP
MIGKKMPIIKLSANGGKKVDSTQINDKKIVIYFYPKDNTPGCTIETKDFSKLYKQFKEAGAEVIGISRDSVKSHDKFADKLCVPFLLGSDEEGDICQQFGCWVEKSMFGKKYFGIERSTFVIDEKGVIKNEWRKVKVAGHAQEVLDYIKEM